MQILKKINGFELVDYTHGNGKPAIRFQYRIDVERTNVIGWHCYGNSTNKTRAEALTMIEEAAMSENYELQKQIHS